MSAPGRWRLLLTSLAASVAITAGLATTPAPSFAEGPALSAVAAGWMHSCALTSTGGVKCWGYNEQGQLGDGTNVSRTTPVDVVGLTSGVIAITAGGNHTCALTTGGAVKCWGGNGYGGVGDGTTTDRWVPVGVVGLASGVTAISAGAFHTCAVTSGGGVKCWGLNEFGGIGDGTRIDRWTPVDVSGLASGVVAVAAGGRQSCALSSSGGVSCWGNNHHGELGDGTGVDKLRPVAVVGLTSGVTAITAGGRHTCALTSGGGVKCWGSNDYGQVGDGVGGTLSNRLSPVNVDGLTSGVSSVVAGRWHTCAVTTAGAVKCWGAPDGTGAIDEDRWLSPRDIAGLGSGVLSLAAGEGHTCARLSAGGAKCFGQNFYGELGNGTTTATMTPVDVRFGSAPPTTTTTTTRPTTTTTTTVPGGSAPTVSVGDVSLTEGDAKGRTAYFPVTLSKASAQTITVNYATATGTAVGGDFTAKSGTLTVVAGKVKATVAVPVRGDTADEADEAFSVNLSAPTNATIADGTGTGTIRDDDPGSGVRATIGDVTVYEGNAGAQTATFTVSLSAPSVNTVTVAYATADGTAVAPSDYAVRTGTVTFAPGAVSKSVVISVKSNTGAEPNETFSVVLSNPAGGAAITDNTGVGTIRNDD